SLLSSYPFLFCYVFFFFSSRRRHTRWPRDWSSDVCSSDLIHAQEFCRSCRLRFANHDRFFGGPSVAALFAGREKHNAHGGSVHYVLADRAAAPDRFIVGMRADNEHPLRCAAGAGCRPYLLQGLATLLEI